MILKQKEAFAKINTDKDYILSMFRAFHDCHAAFESLCWLKPVYGNSFHWYFRALEKNDLISHSVLYWCCGGTLPDEQEA